VAGLAHARPPVVSAPCAQVALGLVFARVPFVLWPLRRAGPIRPAVPRGRVIEHYQPLQPHGLGF